MRSRPLKSNRAAWTGYVENHVSCWLMIAIFPGCSRSARSARVTALGVSEGLSSLRHLSFSAGFVTSAEALLRMLRLVKSERKGA